MTVGEEEMSEVCTGIGKERGNKIEQKGMELKENDKKGIRV